MSFEQPHHDEAQDAPERRPTFDLENVSVDQALALHIALHERYKAEQAARRSVDEVEQLIETFDEDFGRFPRRSIGNAPELLAGFAASDYRDSRLLAALNTKHYLKEAAQRGGDTWDQVQEAVVRLMSDEDEEIAMEATFNVQEAVGLRHLPPEVAGRLVCRLSHALHEAITGLPVQEEWPEPYIPPSDS